jgi:hypothetical protein
MLLAFILKLKIILFFVSREVDQINNNQMLLHILYEIFVYNIILK